MLTGNKYMNTKENMYPLPPQMCHFGFRKPSLTQPDIHWKPQFDDRSGRF